MSWSIDEELVYGYDETRYDREDYDLDDDYWDEVQGMDEWEGYDE